MRIHVLVEGPSESALLKGWLPRFLPGHTFRVIQHRGKGRLPSNPRQKTNPKRQGLLDQLPAKLRAYGKQLNPDTDRVLVLVDLDNQECMSLKRRLIQTLEACDPRPTALFRIAIEETEAFYLGDRAAILKAFPGARINKMGEYSQDEVCGTWELFQAVIGARVEDKVQWALSMAPHLSTDWRGLRGNLSPSFHQLCRGLLALAGEPVG